MIGDRAEFGMQSPVAGFAVASRGRQPDTRNL
jgi:hypothetical protein